jgi:UDP-N-acetylglucosamine 2-epimerase
VTETLEALKSLDMPALWFWPNVDAGSDGTSKGIRSFRETREPAHMHFFRNMEPTDFLQLLSRARCIVGNSSVGIRECSYLGVPAVNVGSRQHRRERGPNVVDVGHDRREIAEAVGRQTAAPRPVSDVTYGDGHAGRRIAELLSRVRLRCDKQLAY